MASLFPTVDGRLTDGQSAFMVGLDALGRELGLTRLNRSASDATWSEELGLEVRLEHLENPDLLIMIQVDPTDEVDLDLPRLNPRDPAEAGIRLGFGEDVPLALTVLEAALRGDLTMEILERGGREVEVAIIAATKLVQRVRFGVLPLSGRQGVSRVEQIPSFR